MRAYNELIDDALDALPSREEIAALSNEQIENLRRWVSTYDNVLYLARMSRRDKQEPTP